MLYVRHLLQNKLLKSRRKTVPNTLCKIKLHPLFINHRHVNTLSAKFIQSTCPILSLKSGIILAILPNPTVIQCTTHTARIRAVIEPELAILVSALHEESNELRRFLSRNIVVTSMRLHVVVTVIGILNRTAKSTNHTCHSVSKNDPGLY